MREIIVSSAQLGISTHSGAGRFIYSEFVGEIVIGDEVLKACGSVDDGSLMYLLMLEALKNELDIPDGLYEILKPRLQELCFFIVEQHYPTRVWWDALEIDWEVLF